MNSKNSDQFSLKQLTTVILIAALAIVNYNTASAQERTFERGLYASMLLGNTDLNDDRFSGMVQPFIRHGITNNLRGELSVGIGILNSSEYQTRILPVEYQFLLYPFGETLFLYAGAGVMNYSQLRILRPDDPLTVDAGKTIPNSSFWSFGDNWTYTVPFGLGTTFTLDERTRLTVKAGYTLTGTDNLEALAMNRDGYFSLSVGLSFRGRRAEVPVPAPVYVPEPEETVTEIVEEEQEIVEEVITEEEVVPEPVPPVILPDLDLPTMINFELLSADIVESEIVKLEEVVRYLERYEDRAVLFNGHTDNTGTATLNDVLSEQRARNARLWLISNGINPNRVAATFRGYREPLADNSTEEGRRMNRRVEFESVPLHTIDQHRDASVAQSNWPQAELLDLPEPGEVIEVDPMLFDVMRSSVNESHLLQIASIHALMTRESDLRIDIIGNSDNLANQEVNLLVSITRASSVAEILIDHGIDPDRIRVLSVHEHNSVTPQQMQGRIQFRRQQ